MSGAWTDKGQRVPVTILALDQAQVVGHKLLKRDGYTAALVGSTWKGNAVKSLSRAQLGQFAAARVSPKKYLREFRAQNEATLPPVGTVLTVDWFKVGQRVDVKGISKGKGFAGVMKRWGFAGLPASHGVSRAHRSAGSVGQNTTPARVLPGRKMAGRMGGKSSTRQNVEILEVDVDHNWIIVKGPIPGPNKAYVMVSDAIKMAPSSAL